MIGEYTLERLCKKYNLSTDKLVKKNNNILVQGEYLEIDKTLNYLVNVLGISSRNIEKCPSILYRNVAEIENNVKFLKQNHIRFSDIESCLHVLSTKSSQLQATYNYVLQNYGVKAISANTSILSCPIDIIQEVENLNLNVSHNGILTIAAGIAWGRTSVDDIMKTLQSQEYKDHPELFTSTTLARARLEDIQAILQSQEYKDHPELFTSYTLAYAKLEDIQAILQSQEYKDHPELFTVDTLAHAKLEDIQSILQSQEYKDHPELFASYTLARAKLEDIRAIIQSQEYKDHPELFTADTLARARLEDIQAILQSQEYKDHPELFTSTTLAHAKLEDIRAILQSQEYKNHPELFTSHTLAYAKLEDIQAILSLSYFSDEKYKKLLSSTIISKGKQMVSKIPILIDMAVEYKIDEYITSMFLLLSPSQNYAIINYLLDNGISLVIDEKLHPFFGKTAAVLSKNHGVNIKELIQKYPLIEKYAGGIKK